MSAKFTPGPWVAEYFRDTISGGYFICDQRGYIVATVHDNNSSPENAANSLLIEAAPDLFESLEELCVQAEAVGAVGIYWDNARAAIAKAKG